MLSKFATLAILASASATPIRRSEPSLSVTTEAPATIDSVEDLWVLTLLKNTGSQPIDFNTYDTVFSNPETNDYDVDGSEASGKAKGPTFVGVYAKHVTDVATLRKLGKLKTLAPGETVSSNNTLAGRYDLTPSGSGAYKIGAKPKFQVLTPNADKFQTVQATVEKATVQVAGTLGRTQTRLSKRDIAFGECSAEQQQAITLAAKNAQAGSEAALSHLEQNPAGDETFTQWFGALSAGSVSTASEHYKNMNGLFANVKYDCAYCASETGTFAMVQPDDISTIYLCGHYWEATPCGTDSQQGTLIHEASHFTAVAGTDDIVYGQADAAALAASSPTQALMNADNHEYFEEAVFSECSTS